MANNYVPNSDLAFIIGDGGISRPSPAPTKVGGDKVNACLELQSITRADLFLKPKTDAQIALIPNPTSGMIAFSSDTNALMVRGSVNWSAITPSLPFPILYSSVDLTTAQIRTMYTTPVVILPAPDAGLTYIVHGLKFSLLYAGALFTGGGVINAQYGTFTAGTGEDATNTFAATFLTATASGKFCYITGNDSATLTSNGTLNQPLTFTNSSAVFAGGGTSTGKVEVWYSIV